MYKTSTFSLDHHYVQTNVHFLVWRTFNYPLLLKIILKVTKEERLVLTFLTTTKNPNLPSQYVSFFNITKNLMLLKYWFYMIICVQCKIFNATYQIKKKKRNLEHLNVAHYSLKEYFLLISVNYEFLIYFLKVAQVLIWFNVSIYDMSFINHTTSSDRQDFLNSLPKKHPRKPSLRWCLGHVEGGTVHFPQLMSWLQSFPLALGSVNPTHPKGPWCIVILVPVLPSKGRGGAD